jgi:hypothetical protein
MPCVYAMTIAVGGSCRITGRQQAAVPLGESLKPVMRHRDRQGITTPVTLKINNLTQIDLTAYATMK